MPNKPRAVSRIIAGLLLTSFCFTTLAAPYAEASFWTERRKTATLLAKAPGAGLPRVDALTGGPRFPSVPQQLNFPPTLTHHLPQDFVLPLAYTNFKRAGVPKDWKASDPLIIHIQDVHQNYEAQGNIGKS